jgi:glyoxylate/hydroxypyruvate reductase A
MHISQVQNINVAFHSTQFSITEWQDAFDVLAENIQLNAVSTDNVSENDISCIDVLLIWKPSVTDWRSANRLQHVIYLGASADHIDAKPLQLPDGVIIHRLHDAGMKTAMCDYAEYAVLHYQRRFDLFLQAQKSRDWISQRDYRQRHDINVSILGLGILGSAIATHLQNVGYCVSGWSRSPKHIEGVETFFEVDSIKKCLNKCDIIINMLPHTKDTHHFLNHERLSLLPKGASLISLSRGAIIDTTALLKLLDSEHLRGAFLDVFEQEPLPKESTLWSHPKVTLTPHQSAPTQIIEAAKEITTLLKKHTGSNPIKNSEI